MFRIRKQFKIEMAHRLSSAYSACCTDQIHGHSYLIEVFLEAPKLNEDGMIMDFGELKRIIGEYIDQWDHALVLPENMAEGMPTSKLIKTDYNPTAEAMAYDMLNHIDALLSKAKHRGASGARVYKVRIHETVTGWAEFESDR